MSCELPLANNMAQSWELVSSLWAQPNVEDNPGPCSERSTRIILFGPDISADLNQYELSTQIWRNDAARSAGMTSRRHCFGVSTRWYAFSSCASSSTDPFVPLPGSVFAGFGSIDQ